MRRACRPPPSQDGKATGEQRPEGRVTRIAYRTGPGPSMLRGLAQFRDAAHQRGLRDGVHLRHRCLRRHPVQRGAGRSAHPADVGGRLQLSLLRRPQGGRQRRRHLGGVVASQNNDDITTELVVTEVGAIANKMIDAAAMAKGLGETGHIALYGIYFDTDKAVVKAESKPTLDQIAALLQGAPDLQVVIVGHTDSQGTLAYNMDLSQRRAAAVAAALSKSYGIAAARLKTAGVGFLAPVGSNQTEDGRALNRRVELVEP